VGLNPSSQAISTPPFMLGPTPPAPTVSRGPPVESSSSGALTLARCRADPTSQPKHHQDVSPPRGPDGLVLSSSSRQIWKLDTGCSPHSSRSKPKLPGRYPRRPGARATSHHHVGPSALWSPLPMTSTDRTHYPYLLPLLRGFVATTRATTIKHLELVLRPYIPQAIPPRP
jgi:hypothetical protein